MKLRKEKKMTINRTKVITGKNTRLSYFNGREPKTINGGI